MNIVSCAVENGIKRDLIPLKDKDIVFKWKDVYELFGMWHLSSNLDKQSPMFVELQLSNNFEIEYSTDCPIE